MKKILFLLLCTVQFYGQTSTGQEQEFDYGIKNNSTQTITTPTYIGTFGTDGTQGKIPSAYIAKTADIADSLATKENIANKSNSYTTSSSTTYASTKALVDGLGTKIGGTLTSGYIPKATGANSLGNSLIYDNSTNVGIGTTSPNYSSAGRTVVDVNGTYQSMLALSVGGVGKGFLFYTGTDILISNENNGSIKLNTNGSQKAEITAGGNVLIGTSTDNGIDKLQANGTITATGGTTANQVVVKSQLDGKVSLTGNETVAGNKTLSGTTTLNETIIREGYQLKFPKGVMYQSSVGTNALTDNRTVSFPDASGTIALVETVRPYKVYTALLSQSGTSAPTATVLENTLGGTIVWSYNSTGTYIGTLTGAFTSNKTAVFITGSFGGYVTNAASTSVNDVTFTTVKSDTGAYTNGVIANTSIEIRVYN